MTWCLGAAVLAVPRGAGERSATLHETEVAFAAKIHAPNRRSEWVEGRSALKELAWRAFRLEAPRLATLPGPEGAPRLRYDADMPTALTPSITHTRKWIVAALAIDSVGIDGCDLDDAKRVKRVRERAFSDGELAALGTLHSEAQWAAAWAIKEAVLKLHRGGIFDPGASSVWVTAIAPPAVRGAIKVALLALPETMVAIARSGRNAR